ncbi:type IVB secretion system protein IcmW [Cysteiniphilum sp. 6C5]|uniref:type IVB secretion system protein IcmW n=1 Tax=unclassified Cysteiniphilum TaxID=2610889 RepID=UPI003F833754
MDNRSEMHHFKAEIINYWHGFGKPELVDMLTVYDIKENKESESELSNEIYDRLYEVYLEARQQKEPSEEYADAIIHLCDKLPTALMMFMMQNINKKNGDLFQMIYQRLSNNLDYELLYKRCMSFEKNLILVRVCSEARLLKVENVLNKVLDENYAN